MADEIKPTATKPLTEKESIAALQDWQAKVAAPNPQHKFVDSTKKVEAPKKEEKK